jgi:TadE-like protein
MDEAVMFYSRWRTLKAGKAEDSGQTVVEFALATTIFLVLIFATFNFAFLFYSKVTLQNAVRQAGRFAITGNCGTDGGPGSNCFVYGPGDRLHVILQTVTKYSFGLNPTVTVQCMQGACPGYAGGGSNNAGGPGDTVKIWAQYTWHPIPIGKFFPSSGYLVIVSSTYKNESFAPPPPS